VLSLEADLEGKQRDIMTENKDTNDSGVQVNKGPMTLISNISPSYKTQASA